MLQGPMFLMYRLPRTRIPPSTLAIALFAVLYGLETQQSEEPA